MFDAWIIPQKYLAQEAELRRLHEVNQELLEALVNLLDAFDLQMRSYEDQECQQQARAAIAKATGENK